VPGLRRGFHGRSRSRRTTAWAVGPQDLDGSFSASGSALWSSAVVTALAKITIVRTRGLFHVTLKTADAVGAGFFGAFGIALVTSAAHAAGVASVPTPLTESDWDGWLFHHYFDVRSITATLEDGPSASQRIVIDSKAMRIFDEDMTLIGVTEVIESINATVETTGEVRILTKLG